MINQQVLLLVSNHLVGSRASGTNDKAGAPANLLRWTSQRTVKETFTPPTDYKISFYG